METSRTYLLTAVAMVAFAANSVLCRSALGGGFIDAAGFTLVRAGSGAVFLALLVWLRCRHSPLVEGSWRQAVMLFAYMVFFSFAYLSLDAGTGALVLFAAVQLTMFGAALRDGERFGALSWVGLALAASGLVYLVAPGVSAPAPAGAAMMAVAGVAWGFYSLVGRGRGDPLAATAGNFLRALPFALAVGLVFIGTLDATPSGLALAIASGAVASGCGYAIWYAALPGLGAARAATVQLSVPVIAAFGGILLLGESLTWRLAISSLLTLSGVAIVLRRRGSRGRA